MNAKIRSGLTALLAMTGMWAGHGTFAAPDASTTEPRSVESKSLYWQGHAALQEADWNDAFEKFKALESRLRKDEPASVDAALYWQAYALMRAGRSEHARATIKRLEKEFPQSAWRDDARTLLTREGASKAPETIGATDGEALNAIEGLMSAPAEDAAPLLLQVLQGQYTLKTRKRALFVLSQLGDAAAMKRVSDIARGTDAELRDEAIRMLGVGGATGELAMLYAETKDEKTRHSALRALGVAGGDNALIDVANSTADLATRREAIQSLGVAGGRDALAKIAGGKADLSLRREAIKALGVAGGSAQLLNLYAQVETPELRNEVAQALFVSGDGKELAELYDKATTPEEKATLRRLLQEQN